MAYNNYSNKKHNNDFKKRDDAPKKFIKKKPVTVNVPFVVTGNDQYGNTYNAESATVLVEKFRDNNTFAELSVMATIAKSTLLGKDVKGNLNLARVMDFNSETGDMSLLFFGKIVDHADRMENMVVVPRVMTDRETSDVTCITGFEVVPAMEA